MLSEIQDDSFAVPFYRFAEATVLLLADSRTGPASSTRSVRRSPDDSMNVTASGSLLEADWVKGAAIEVYDRK
jgi:hypothetical protein